MTQALEDRLRILVASSLGWEPRLVQPGNANSPAVDGLHASLLLVSEEPRGYAVIEDHGTGREVASMQMRSTYSLQFYGGGAHDAARRFRMWAQSGAGLDAVEHDPGPVRYRLVQPFGARRLDAVDDDRWEQRVVIDLAVDWVDVLMSETVPVDARRGDMILSTPSADYQETIEDG